MNFAWLIYLICLVVMAVIYIVSRQARFKRLQREYDANLDQMQEIYESRRESWIKEIEALKEDNDSLKVDNIVLQADNTSLKEEQKHLDAAVSCLSKEKTDIEIKLVEANQKIQELITKLCNAEAWWVGGHSDVNERVFVCSVTRSGEKRINIAYYKDGKWHGNGNLDNVIAWKPLPELPEFEDPAEGGEA